MSQQEEELSELVIALLQRRAAFFLSAGCSLPEIPAAASLAEQAALTAYAGHQDLSFNEFKAATFGDDQPTLDRIAQYYLDRDGSLEEFVNLLPLSKWRAAAPTEAHRAVVRMAMEDLFESVITTNWDVLLETAANELGCDSSSLRMANELGCDSSSLRMADDLRIPNDAQLRIFKIHGCISYTPSIVAATSELELPGVKVMWARPELESALMGRAVVFVGYSGSVPRIADTMKTVAEWYAGARHHIVDVNSWDEFRDAAGDFCECPQISATRYWRSGAQEFMLNLQDRAIKQMMMEVEQAEAPVQYQNLLQLSSALGDEEYEANLEFFEQVCNCSGAEELLKTGLAQDYISADPAKQGDLGPRLSVGELPGQARLETHGRTAGLGEEWAACLPGGTAIR